MLRRTFIELLGGIGAALGLTPDLMQGDPVQEETSLVKPSCPPGGWRFFSPHSRLQVCHPVERPDVKRRIDERADALHELQAEWKEQWRSKNPDAKASAIYGVPEYWAYIQELYRRYPTITEPLHHTRLYEFVPVFRGPQGLVSEFRAMDVTAMKYLREKLDERWWGAQPIVAYWELEELIKNRSKYLP